MTANDTSEALRRASGRKFSLAEGALHAVMVGVAESYLGAFAVELGHGDSRLALLATLPLFLGACSQLLSPAAAHLLGSRKRLVLLGATLQAASLGGLAMVAWRQDARLAPLLVAKCAFWVSASVIVPAWNAWMGDLTEGTERSRYFARRSAATHAVLLLAFGAAGYVLNAAQGSLTRTYTALFCVALLARLASVVFFYKQYDPKASLAPAKRRRNRFRFREMLNQSDFKVARYLALLALGTQLSGPFFTPLMLRELKLGYGTFAALSAVSILAKAVTFRSCHHIANRLGLRLHLILAGTAVSAIPLLWMASTSTAMLVFVHLFGGIAWASIEYTGFQLQLGSARPRVAAEFFAVSNALASAAGILGALLGGFLLTNQVFDFDRVFLASAGLRAAPLVALVVAFQSSDVPRRHGPVFARILGTRPGAGAIQRPIVIPEPDEK